MVFLITEVGIHMIEQSN